MKTTYVTPMSYKVTPAAFDSLAIIADHLGEVMGERVSRGKALTIVLTEYAETIEKNRGKINLEKRKKKS